MRGWPHDHATFDLTFENSCQISSSSASQLSECRLLQKVNALYTEAVNYSKSVSLTFCSLSIACLGSVYVDVTHVTLTPRPSRFSACNIEKLGWAWGRGYCLVHWLS